MRKCKLRIKNASKIDTVKKENTTGFKKGNQYGFKKGHHSKTEFKKGHKINFGRRWKMLEEQKKKLREWQLRHPNKKFCNTKIEQKIAEELTRREIYYQQNIGLVKIANVDFYLPEYRIVIECDGDYYHNMPGMKEKDEKKTNLLKFNGFNVHRFWEHEINKSPEGCVNKIIF